MAVGLSLIGLLEAACVLLGWGKPALQADPFVGFSSVQPLFVRDGAGGHFVTAPSRLKHFPPERFAQRKPPGMYRVFCFGGSTVQGNPYSKETAFSTWLQLSLAAAEPDRQFEVINCGGISYATYRLANLVQECLAYEPDLFILCTGHNEFLEDRTYTKIKHAPPWLSATTRLAGHLRTFNLLHGAWLELPERKTRALAGDGAPANVLQTEADPWLDYEGGIKVYHRDETWRAGVIEHFELNLRRMIGMSQQASVPLILVQPTSNLRDCPPFKSQHLEGLSPADLLEWETLTTEAGRARGVDRQRELKLLQQALTLDDQYAVTHFQLAQCLEALGQTDKAREAYLAAREMDVCPLRILRPMEAVLQRVAADTETPFINAQSLIAERSQNGLPGDDWLLDHIHPSIEGHQLIADALQRRMMEAGWTQTSTGWEARRKEAFARHLAALPAAYYAEGERALTGLRAWTEGRASGPPIDYRLFGKRGAGAQPPVK